MNEQCPLPYVDSSVSPIMGCSGCELYSKNPKKLLRSLNQRLPRIFRSVTKTDVSNSVTLIMGELLKENLSSGNFDPKLHGEKLTSDHLYQLRYKISDFMSQYCGVGDRMKPHILRIIEEHVACPAARMHALRGYSTFDTARQGDPRYADRFSQPKKFPGSVKAAAAWPDLMDTSAPAAPWIEGLPRLILVNEFGDSLSSGAKRHLEWLNRNALAPMRTEHGQNHIWLWMTKRPHNLQKLAKLAGGLPDNLCAMTAITSGGPEEMQRLSDIQKVDAFARALCLDPMVRRIPPEVIDLRGIDWVIIGGERGRSGRPFDINWALEMINYCRKNNVAVFVSQLGHNVVEYRARLKLEDPNGRDWNEWPVELKVRNYTEKFHLYRDKNSMSYSERQGHWPASIRTSVERPSEKLDWAKLERGRAAFQTEYDLLKNEGQYHR